MEARPRPIRVGRLDVSARERLWGHGTWQVGMGEWAYRGVSRGSCVVPTEGRLAHVSSVCKSS